MNPLPKGMHDVAKALTKAHADMNSMIYGYMSAATKSNAAAWQGLEDITRNIGGVMHESFTHAVNAGTTLMAAKTSEEAVATHSDFLKHYVDRIITGSNQVSEISLRAAQSAIDPLAQHTNEAIGTIIEKTKAA